tara:strand:+ start:146 stop:529 length:384 start_codon:yes stop_codon:yes gene_type:complete
MLNPFAQILAGSISLWDFSKVTSTSYGYIWAVNGGFGVFAAFTQLLWFHEFLKGGPETEDNVFSNFNRVAVYVYIVNFFLTAAGFVLDGQGHIVSLATNSVTLVFGILIIYLVQESIDKHELDEQRY